MPRNVIATSLSLFALLAAGTASAQPAAAPPRSSLGEQGQMIFGAERVLTLFAFESSKTVDTSQAGVTQTVSASQTSSSILGSNPAGPGGGITTFYKIPRLGFDYVVIPNLTVGGSAMMLFTLGSGETSKTETAGRTTTTNFDGSSITLFGLAPRVGYVIALSEMFAIWPRGGLSFYSASVRSPSDPNAKTVETNTISQWALDAEGLFVFTPFPHVGITAGLAFDVPITGSLKNEKVTGPTTTTTTFDASLWHVGINAGLIVYF